jgi:hypothetical protein
VTGFKLTLLDCNIGQTNPTMVFMSISNLEETEGHGVSLIDEMQTNDAQQ